MKLVTLILLSGAALMGSGCSSPVTVTTNQSVPTVAASPANAVSATPDEFAVARVAFQKNCADCHGEDGKGGMKTIDGKKMNVPGFHEGHALKHSDEDFVKQIMNGDDGMPAFKDKLSTAEINDLVKFIRKEFQGK